VPHSSSSIWSGFGGACELGGAGDPVVLYDHIANRWLISQFASLTGTAPITDECVAISTTADATGTYARYGFHLGLNFFDYPKLSVWPTAPFGSGGAQLQPTPGNGMPLKLRMGVGTFGASRLSVETRLFWMTGSGVSWCRYGTFGFSFASCSAFKSDAFHRGILRSGGEISFLYEAPTVRPLDCWFAFGACADNDPAENKPSPTSASKTAIE